MEWFGQGVNQSSNSCWNLLTFKSNGGFSCRMYFKGILPVLLAVLLGTDTSSALSVDPVASTELEALIKNDFVISIRHIR